VYLKDKISRKSAMVSIALQVVTCRNWPLNLKKKSRTYPRASDATKTAQFRVSEPTTARLHRLCPDANDGNHAELMQKRIQLMDNAIAHIKIEDITVAAAAMPQLCRRSQ
jgi:hypothetical protein